MKETMTASADDLVPQLLPSFHHRIDEVLARLAKSGDLNGANTKQDSRGTKMQTLGSALANNQKQLGPSPTHARATAIRTEKENEQNGGNEVSTEESSEKAGEPSSIRKEMRLQSMTLMNYDEELSALRKKVDDKDSELESLRRVATHAESQHEETLNEYLTEMKAVTDGKEKAEKDLDTVYGKVRDLRSNLAKGRTHGETVDLVADTLEQRSKEASVARDRAFEMEEKTENLEAENQELKDKLKKQTLRCEQLEAEMKIFKEKIRGVSTKAKLER